MKTYITIKTQFEAIHCWPECPIEAVSFLRNEHRHLFIVKCKAPVYHDDRDREFIHCKHEIEDFVREQYDRRNLGRKSCEMLCKEIQKAFPFLSYVRVEEDGENGAELIV